MNDQSTNMNKYITKKNGLSALLYLTVGFVASTVIFFIMLNILYGVLLGLFITTYVILITALLISLAGLKIVKPNEARVFTLFGKYYGTIIEDGFYFVSPFVSNESSKRNTNTVSATSNQVNVDFTAKHMPLKEMTLINEKQKVNDLDGNPIEIGVVIIWKIVDPYKAVFNVDSYRDYLSTQCDGVIRNVARSYPYDIANAEEDEKSLRGSTTEIAEILKNEIQNKVDVAGIEILEARVSHLAYAVEIASAMLQRQQAKAIVDARTQIVEGAVSMVEMALDQLNEKDIVQLDEERKAQMVSNLLVVLCSNKDTQPIVNSGSIY